jgi:hypothetical protein
MILDPLVAAALQARSFKVLICDLLENNLKKGFRLPTQFQPRPESRFDGLIFSVRRQPQAVAKNGPVKKDPPDESFDY